jgi:formamidopyrimidine-DNA glycosylase
MPELPEVHTIVEQLKTEIVGKKIDDIEVRLSKIVKGPIDEVIGETIKVVERRAKLIRIRLDGTSIVVHLKMTGQLFYLEKGKDKTLTGEGENKFTHVIFHFSDASKLLFNDIRQFGYVKVLPNEEVDRIVKENYGPEPLEKDFTADSLEEILKKRGGMQMKALLLDQSVIAGIGNLYSDEVLYLAGIHPKRKAKEVSRPEVKVLFDAIREVLLTAIRYKGTSMDTYLQTTGERGTYGDHRFVYRKIGQPCPKKDGGIIEALKFGGRTAHFCPVHQK